VWRNNDLDPHVGGAILLGEYLYGSNWRNLVEDVPDPFLLIIPLWLENVK
jgi:hypothetical protein